MQSTRPSPRYGNTNAPGLPAAPRARSVAPAASRDYAPREYYDDARPARDVRPAGLPSSMRQMRPQRQATHDAPPERAPARGGYERAYGEREYMSSTSSVSSSNSSLLDRMRVRSSESTPRTSLEEDDYAPSKGQSPNRDNHGSQVEAAPAEQASGSWLWNAVSGAAANLTVNVSKAWAADLETGDGEATPLGQESRLTRAMKAYHLEKARNPSDLPDWLFSAQERNPGRARQAESAPRPDEFNEPERAQPPRARGLRDIYDKAAAEPVSRNTRPMATRASPTASAYGRGDEAVPSRAADRLKAMRDARRQAAGISDGRDGGDVGRRAPPSGVDVSRDEGRMPRGPGGRVGLPTSPGKAKRF